MGAIELKMAMISGMVIGLFFVVAEAAAMRQKLVRYFTHLKNLQQSGRRLRLYAEYTVMVVVIMIQPVTAGILVSKALGHFNPQFSDHAMAQLKHGLHTDN